MNLDNQIIKILCCPNCHSELLFDKSIICSGCKDEYFKNLETGQLDLRLKRSKEVIFKQNIGVLKNAFNEKGDDGVYNFKFGLSKSEDSLDFSRISKKNRKPVDKIYSWLPNGGGINIDIGCSKDNNNKRYLELAKFKYVSVDYDSPDAMILADAHALPFKNNSVDCITNLAVMEHIEFPHIAGREFYRILKEKGKMLGVVAFIQQQHMSSWYHFTHYGTYSWLKNSGFNPKKFKIGPAGKKYHGIYTTASLIGLHTWVKNSILNPIYYLHRLLWWIYKVKSGIDKEEQRHLQTTGAINFVAER